AGPRIGLDVARKLAVAGNEEPQRALVIELLRSQRAARRQATAIRRGDHRDRRIADLRPQARYGAADVAVANTRFAGLCLVGHSPSLDRHDAALDAAPDAKPTRRPLLLPPRRDLVDASDATGGT